MDEEQRRLTVDDIKLKLENIKEVKKDNLKFRLIFINTVNDF